MNSSLILSITTFVYAASAFFYIMAWIFRKTVFGRIAFVVATIGLLGNIAGFGFRWVESYQLGFGRAPLSNLYESLIFFALSITALYLLVVKRQDNQVMGAFVMPIAFLCMAYASLSPNINDQIQPLLPALKSNWLIAHVITGRHDRFVRCRLGDAGIKALFETGVIDVIGKRPGDPGLPGHLQVLSHSDVGEKFTAQVA
jgi:ABC-type transport system involved in cytochrome c biogenesis permease subunit